MHAAEQIRDSPQGSVSYHVIFVQLRADGIVAQSQELNLLVIRIVSLLFMLSQYSVSADCNNPSQSGPECDNVTTMMCDDFDLMQKRRKACPSSRSITAEPSDAGQ